MTTQRIQLLLFIILVPVGFFFWYLHEKDMTVSELISPAPRMRIGDLAVRVELAMTPAERMRGLSGRDEIGTDGLLFVFPESDYHGIWMKDMRFPIDIIWIDEALTIIHIEHNVQPDTYPKVFRPRTPARYVLETNSHYVETFGYTVGQTVTLPVQVLEEN